VSLLRNAGWWIIDTNHTDGIEALFFCFSQN